MFKRLGKKDIIESNEPIDSDEQERITKSLIDEALVSSKTIRQTFSWIFLLVALIFVIVLAYSSAYPMLMSHQAVFAGYVPHYYFQLFYALTIVSLYGDASYVKGSQKIMSGISIGSSSGIFLAILSLSLTIVWAYIFWLNGVTNPILYWIPTVNILAFGLAVYIDRDMSDLVRQAENINSLKYNYRAL